jgi:hypothetical protein
VRVISLIKCVPVTNADARYRCSCAAAGTLERSAFVEDASVVYSHLETLLWKGPSSGRAPRSPEAKAKVILVSIVSRLRAAYVAVKFSEFRPLVEELRAIVAGACHAQRNGCVLLCGEKRASE